MSRWLTMFCAAFCLGLPCSRATVDDEIRFLQSRIESHENAHDPRVDELEQLSVRIATNTGINVTCVLQSKGMDDKFGEFECVEALYGLENFLAGTTLNDLRVQGIRAIVVGQFSHSFFQIDEKYTTFTLFVPANSCNERPLSR